MGLTTHQIRREIAKLENRLDRTTSSYSKAKTTLDRIKELEAELEYRTRR